MVFWVPYVLLFLNKVWRSTSHGDSTMSQELRDDSMDSPQQWVLPLAQKIEDEVRIVEEFFAGELNQIAALYGPTPVRLHRINTGRVQDLNGLMHLIKDFQRERGDFEACYLNEDCCEVLCTFYDSLSDFVRDNEDLHRLVKVHSDIKPFIPKMREATTHVASEKIVQFYLTHASAQTLRAKQAYCFMTSRPEIGKEDDAVLTTHSMTPLFRSCLHFGTISRYKATRDRQKLKHQQNESNMPKDAKEHSREVIRFLISVCVAVAEIPQERLQKLKLKYAWVRWIVHTDLIDEK